jgi:two-component system, OmpR family, sensor histidine kinase BaeS
LSRIESGAYNFTKAPVEVSNLIESCVEVERYRSKSLGLALTTEIPQGLPRIEVDFEASCRVIRGLVDNAFKYTPEGGRVVVSARIDDDMVAIAIEDNGAGIHPDDIPHVFDKFYRAARFAAVEEEEDDRPASPGTAAPGVGLGLYLAKHIIEQLGGRITLDSEFGAGTTFTVFLPVWVPGRNSEVIIEDEANVEAIAGS